MSRRIYIAGHRGMVGSAIRRRLSSDSSVTLVVRSRAELDLTNQEAVRRFFEQEQIDEVYLAAARVGGIQANNEFPADFIYDNLMIECNVIHAAFTSKVGRLLFLGSSCIYPKMAEQPMSEAALLSGELEATNEPYAIAKIAGIKLCESYNRQHGTDFRSVMPTNLYGPNDNFHPEHSHVIPAMMRRFHEAKQAGAESVVVWGTGKPMREFLHVDDMADACLHVMSLSKSDYQAATNLRESLINIGTGTDCTIRELAETMAQVVGFDGRIEFDTSKPDGTPRKLLNVARLHGLGWEASIGLRQGLQETYQWYLQNEASIRGGGK